MSPASRNPSCQPSETFTGNAVCPLRTRSLCHSVDDGRVLVQRCDLLLVVNGEGAKLTQAVGQSPTITKLSLVQAVGDLLVCRPVDMTGLLALTRMKFSFADQKSKSSEDGARPPLLLSTTDSELPYRESSGLKRIRSDLDSPNPIVFV